MERTEAMKALNFQSLRLLGLQAMLALARIGWGATLAGLLCLAGATGLWWFAPQLRIHEEMQQQDLLRARQSLRVANTAAPAPPRSIVEERLAKFQDTLGEKHYAEQQVKTLFAIAAKAGLSLQQAEYKSVFDKHSNTHAYQIRLPVKGPYPAIRQFCEQTLQAIPFASLDEISFKREAIGSEVLEAKLRITLFLADAPVTHGKRVVWE